jgi:hypothetical protein
MNSCLDKHSAFFYDGDHEIMNSVYTSQHRKVVYNFWVPYHADQGTHVSGTVTGNADCGNCSLSTYNGIAPGSKLAFFGGLPFDSSILFVFLPGDLMDLVGSPVTSNSWGLEDLFPNLNYIGNTMTGLNPDKLYMFAASNSG